ncbi:DNA ligase [Thalassotalea castellviae]|uniref:DNA ligase n=1 Tax=Thalassotalea castellviae TaxID=3075612 RepID=A0ABU3A7W4_9GAMM|nr:DNA ligase [Thalassotalea sp. W431]MDT0605071.1 DNA ligase [Thalassotalea sp. W431]
MSVISNLLVTSLSFIIFSGYAQKPSNASLTKPSFQPPIQHGVVMQENIRIQEYWVSEKLDGIRGYWNGTKLFSRSGNEINLPPWFTKGWPNTAMDGEIWRGRNAFESTASCVSLQKDNNACWQTLRFMIFDLPGHKGTFSQRIIAMKTLIRQASAPSLKMIKQMKIASKAELYQRLDQVVKQHGEGLMLHHQDALYQQGRSKKLMKLKKYQDAEARVIQHIPGKGKYQQMLGSLLVETQSGLQFKIGTGFSDLQRKNPPPIGAIITYQFIGKTKRGVPRFASFKRIRNMN